MSEIISLGLWIKRRRKALDMTQDELARRVGCSLETIRKIEADARRPSREIAARLADKLASGRIAAGTDLYSKTDLADIRANLNAIAKIVSLLKPVIETSAPALAADVDDKLAAVQSSLTELEGDGRFISYDTVDLEAREELSAKFNALAGALDRLNPAVGVG